MEALRLVVNSVAFTCVAGQNRSFFWYLYQCNFHDLTYDTMIIFSKNPLFVTLGRLGTKFGETYRSQIFFISFWISFFSLVLIAVAVCSVSLEPSVVTSVPFFHGKVALTNTSTSVTSELNFYAGLNILVFEDCSDEVGAAVCPPRSQSWGSVECEQYFNHCDECRDSSTGSVTTVLIALVTQFLQIGCDIQRSTGDYITCDLKVFSFQNCLFIL